MFVWLEVNYCLLVVGCRKSTIILEGPGNLHSRKYPMLSVMVLPSFYMFALLEQTFVTFVLQLTAGWGS